MAIRYVDNEGGRTPKAGEPKQPQSNAPDRPAVAPSKELPLGQDEKPDRPKRKPK